MTHKHEVTINETTATITKQCLNCSLHFELTVPKDGYIKWQTGTMIQDALPELTPGDRELLISGICNTCFNKLFEKD